MSIELPIREVSAWPPSDEQEPKSEDETVVLIAPPPTYHSFATFFRPLPDVLNQSRAALRVCQDLYRGKYSSETRPFRAIETRATGLPAYMRWFFEPEAQQLPNQALRQDPNTAIQKWLTQGILADAIFSPSSPTAQRSEDFRYLGTTLLPRLNSSDSQSRIEIATAPVYSRAHVSFRQWYKQWPVYGGRVIANVTLDALPASITSSYFPIAESASDKRRFSDVADDLLNEDDEAEPIARARQVMLYYQADLDFPVQGWDGEGWRAGVVRYAGRKICVYPFAGQYYLAFQVVFLSKEGDQGWRVFVDARRKPHVVLGRPESLTAHALSVFNTSGDVISNSPGPLNSQPGTLASGFCTVRWHGDEGGGPVDWGLVESDLSKPYKEALNVVYHAQRTFDYFVNLGGGVDLTHLQEDTNRPPPYFEVTIGKGGAQLDMGFTLATIQPAHISFQTGTGLSMGRRKVDSPALDPEVVCHEIAHGLMAVMNSEPFSMSKESHPFGRALVEGYATYFARALATKAATTEAGEPWARAAYATGHFGMRYDLDRTDRQPGVDLLALPNLYPPRKTTDPDAFPADLVLIRLLGLYDVGMIWARTLWDLRVEFGATVADGYRLVDQLALDAYFHMPGWITSFETAAEAFIDQARISGQFNSAQLNRIASVFGGRNTLAGRGVQTLFEFNGQVLVGTDAGYRVSPDQGQTWRAGTRLGSIGEGVVAFAADGASLYAATRFGVYKWDAVNDAWHAQGSWPSQECPLCLAVFGDTPYVGTADGVWVYAEPSLGNPKQWKQFTTQAPIFCDAVLQIAVTLVNGQPYVYVASLRKPQRRNDSNRGLNQPLVWSANWESAVEIGSSADKIDASTAVIIVGDEAYVGTYGTGVWQQSTLSNIAVWTRILLPPAIGNGAVLSLHFSGQSLYVAATSGLFRFDRQANGSFSRVENSASTLPVPAVATRVLKTGSNLLVGTANNGLYAWNNASSQWMPFSDIGTVLV